MSSGKHSGQSGTVRTYRNCKSKFYFLNDTKVKYFRFPKNANICAAWLKAAGREDLLDKDCKELYKSYRLCSIHFEDKMYMGPEKTRLLSQATPVQYVSEYTGSKKLRKQGLTDSCISNITNVELPESKENKIAIKRKCTPDVALNYFVTKNYSFENKKCTTDKRCKSNLDVLNNTGPVKSIRNSETWKRKCVLNEINTNIEYDAFKNHIESNLNAIDCKSSTQSNYTPDRKKSQNTKADQNSSFNGLSPTIFYSGNRTGEFLPQKRSIRNTLSDIVEDTIMQKEFEDAFAGDDSIENEEYTKMSKEKSIDHICISNTTENTILKNNTTSKSGKILEINSFMEVAKDWISISSESDLQDEDKENLHPEKAHSQKKISCEANKFEDLDGNVCREIEVIFQSSQYRKDVQLLFDEIEYSVCRLGTSQDRTMTDNKTASKDKLSDPSLKISQLITNQLLEGKLERHDAVDDIDWNDDSLIKNALSNTSHSILNTTPEIEENFSSIIKKALLQNAQKLAVVQGLTNATILCTQTVFTELGSFYGLPEKVKDLMKVYRGIQTLYNWQNECLTLPAIKSRKNLVYALPTSGGKTLVAEILMLREIMCRKKNALFVLPFVAIVQEKVWGLSPFAVALDFLVEEYAAGKGTYPPRKRRRKNSIYVATIEKALGLVNSLIDTGRLDELGLVVVDELHLIGDQSRGPTLEALLTKLKFIKGDIHVIGMSATIGNLQEVCQFLDADIFTQNFRPVELVEYVKCENELVKINWNGKDGSELYTFAKNIDFGYSKTFIDLDPDMLGGLVMEIVPKDSCLIFCSTKKNCENVAHLLSKVMFATLRVHRKEEKETLKMALRDESGTLCNILNTSITFGVAYHHSGLTSDERRLIEDGFRAGVICVICCTSTLAAGVNLPAKRVILRQPYIGKEFINLSKYKQMVGRAGRTGFGEFGESILITARADLSKVTDLLLSPMDQALSNMHEDNGKGFMHLLLSCISLGIANTRLKLQKVASQTLLGVQQERLKVNIKKLTDRAITQLFKYGALEVDRYIENNSESFMQNTSSSSIYLDGTASMGSIPLNSSSKTKLHVNISNETVLVISKLGSAAIKSGLDLSSAHVLYEDLLQAQASLVLLNCLHLLYLITPYSVSDQVTPSKSYYYGLFMQLQPKELQTARILGLTESCAVKMLNNQTIPKPLERILNRFYVTLMLYDLWNEIPVYQVSEKYQVPRGIVQNLMTLAATFASNVVNFCNELEEFWAFAHLLKGMTERLQHCCVRELKQLMELPSVKQNRAKQLYNAGYKTLASVARADPNDLVQSVNHMSRKLATELIAAAKLLLLEKVENLREEAEDVLDGIDQPKLLNRTNVI